MTTVTFDTLRFVETLKAAGVSEAKAIAQAFGTLRGKLILQPRPTSGNSSTGSGPPWRS
jgi:hypothetical protein